MLKLHFTLICTLSWPVRFPISHFYGRHLWTTPKKTKFCIIFYNFKHQSWIIVSDMIKSVRQLILVNIGNQSPKNICETFAQYNSRHHREKERKSQCRFIKFDCSLTWQLTGFKIHCSVTKSDTFCGYARVNMLHATASILNEYKILVCKY